MPEMYFYKAFGLTIGSEFKLPDLLAADDVRVDLTVRQASIQHRFENEQFDSAITKDEQLFRWGSLGTYRVCNDATVIEIDPQPGVESHYLSIPLFGVVIAAVLHRRGYLVLHASAVQMDDSCVIFLGDKGAGKSTTAAALLSDGHALISDDVVAMVPDADGHLVVLPAFNQIKLMTDAAQKFRPASDKGAIIHPDLTKRRHTVNTACERGAVGIRGVYLLDRGDAARLTVFSGADRLPPLVAHTYLSRFGDAAFWPELAVTHLQACAKLAKQAEIARLVIPHGLDRISEATALIGANG